ncbi:MAG: LptA/OstA family protein, partial [Pirellulales bacterium]
VLSMWGSPELAMAGTGSIAADELHLYLKEAPGRALGPNLPDVLPDRMRAVSIEAGRKVRLRSASFSAAVHEMRLWFVQRHGQAATPAAAGGPVGTNSGRSSNVISRQPKAQGNPYLVGGELLQAEIAMGDGDPAVRNAMLDGNVEIRQASAGKPGARPLIIRGDSLKITNADQPTMHVTILGEPALVQAQELTLQGGEIQLNRGENRLWVDTPGKMSLLARRGLNGEASENGREMHITWKGGMDFNGQTVTFNRSVHAYDADSALHTESLSAMLTRSIRFDGQNESNGQANVEIGRITSPLPVTMNRRSTEGPSIVSREQMEIRNLLIDMVTGELAAQGPGQVSTVRLRGQTNWMAPNQQAVPAAVPAATEPTDSRTAAKPSGLEYLRVDFQRAVEGNLHRRTLTFIGKVRATYGPVDHWGDRIDIDSPEGLGQDGVMSTSDRLTVREIRLADRERGTVELEAAGNAVVEGRSFFARAQKMRYAQAKELIVLEGDGHTSAKLWQQEAAGKAPATFAARQIFYWRREGRVRVADVNLLNLPLTGTRPAAPGAR